MGAVMPENMTRSGAAAVLHRVVELAIDAGMVREENQNKKAVKVIFRPTGRLVRHRR